MTPQVRRTPRLTHRAGPASAVALQLGGLSAFAVAQPLFDILSRNAEFFVAHRAQPGDLVLLALILSVAVPLVLIAVSWLGAATRGLSGGLTSSLTVSSAAPVAGALMALIALPLLNRVETLPASASILLALALGALGGWGFWRRAGIRRFLTVLSAAAVIFPLWFLFATPIASLLRPPAADYDTGTRAAIPTIRSTTPIVMVVFDELPLASLLDSSDGIERGRYPNFAALADTSHWFRNATTVSETTTYSVPTMLWGRLPDSRRLPTSSDYPDNLFRLLSAGGYGLRVFEWQTSLCDEPVCAEGNPTGSRKARMLSMMSDIAVVYGHLVLPRRLADALPAVDASWSGFAQAGLAPESGSVEDRSPRGDPISFFEPFLEAIDTGRRSTFYFVHASLPHGPWKYFPSGREYGPLKMAVTTPGDERGRWADDEWQVTQAYQRHLLQVGLADTLLGRLSDRLVAAGIFDEAMIVVVADHGISFSAEGRRRALSDSNLDAIVSVPLFVKLPGQTTGTVSRRNVETVDLVPTIAEIVSVEVPWELDGSSVFGPGPERLMKTVRMPRKQGPAESVAYSTQRLEAARRQSVATKLALFGDGSQWSDVFDIGPAGESPSAAPTDFEALLDQPEQWDAVEPDSSYIPALVTGHLAGPGADAGLALAVSVNGLVRATTWSYKARTGDIRFSALLPEDSFRPGENRIGILRLDLPRSPLRAMPVPQPPGPAAAATGG